MSLTDWNNFLRVYRVKHPNLSYKQAQKQASVEYSCKELKGSGNKGSKPSSSISDSSSNYSENLVNFRNVVHGPLDQANIPNVIQDIITGYDVRDPNISIPDLIEERASLIEGRDELNTANGFLQFRIRWTQKPGNRAVMRSNRGRPRRLFRIVHSGYQKELANIQEDIDTRQAQINDIVASTHVHPVNIEDEKKDDENEIKGAGDNQQERTSSYGDSPDWYIQPAVTAGVVMGDHLGGIMDLSKVVHDYLGPYIPPQTTEWWEINKGRIKEASQDQINYLSSKGRLSTDEQQDLKYLQKILSHM